MYYKYYGKILVKQRKIIIFLKKQIVMEDMDGAEKIVKKLAENDSTSI